MSDTLELKDQLKHLEKYMIEKGRMAKGIEIAGKLEGLGFDVPTIAMVTGLHKEEIEILSTEALEDKENSTEDMAGMLLDRRSKAIKDFFSMALQEERVAKENFSCRMRELGFDTPSIANATGLSEEEIESCAGKSMSLLRDCPAPRLRVTSLEPIHERRSSRYEKIAETGVFRFGLRILKDRRKIYNRLKSSNPIESDYGFLLQYEDWSTHKELETSRLYAVLFRLYGEPDTFFDGFKASYNYSFEVTLTYRPGGRCRKVILVAQIRDLKGYQDIKFWRGKRATAGTGEFIDDIISRGDLNICTLLLGRHFNELFEEFANEGFEEFELYQPYLHGNFGYKNGTFFEEREQA